MNDKNIFRHYDRRMQVIVGVALGLCANAILLSCYLLSKLDKINIFEI